MIRQLKNILNTESKKRLFSNFISLSVLRGFQFLIPLISLPYLVRTIGIDNFGLLSFALSLGFYFGAVIQFGFGITATREIARYRENPIKLARIYSATLTASIILAVVSAIIFTLIILSFEKFNVHLKLYLFTLAYIVFQNLFPIWFFQGMEKMKYIAFLTLCTSALFLINLFIFITEQDDYVYVPLIQSVAAMVTFMLSVWVIKKQFNVKYLRPSWKEIKIVYSEGRHAFISQLAPNLYNNSAVFLLGIFTNNSVVGLYSAATKVIDAVISFGYVLSNTFLPYLSRNLQQHKAFQRIMLVSGGALTVITFLLAEWIVQLLFGSENLEVAVYIEWLAGCIFLLFVTMTYGTNFLMLIGRERVVKNIALYNSIIFFVIALSIIPFYGIWGAIVVLVGARLVMALLQFSYYLKYRNQ